MPSTGVPDPNTPGETRKLGPPPIHSWDLERVPLEAANVLDAVGP